MDYWCIVAGCDRRATYGPPGGLAMCCYNHRMMYKATYPPLLRLPPNGSIKCLDNYCVQRATHGPAIGRRIYCGAHAQDASHVPLKLIKCLRCDNTATCGPDNLPIWCSIHQLSSIADASNVHDQCWWKAVQAACIERVDDDLPGPLACAGGQINTPT